MRPIDADALKAYIDCGHLRPPSETCFSELDVVRMLDKQPTIDAEPVRHGRWVYGDDVDIQCSECGKDAMSDWMKYTQVYSPYCPWCGAKMKGGME